MALFTCFDDLPDLVLIELFSYLSSYEILWGFTGLNSRLTCLLAERGFLYHINLSLARYHQFHTMLRFIPLNDIQSLAIDSDASPFQLISWPYLPRLRTLRVIGAYNHDHLLLFILLHAATLTHLIIRSNDTGEYPLWILASKVLAKWTLLVAMNWNFKYKSRSKLLSDM